MKGLQFKSILGYITCRLEGNLLTQFIHYCAKNDIPLWNITVLENEKIEVKFHLTDINIVNKVANDLQIQLIVLKRHGLSIFLLSIWHQKEKVIAFICSLIYLLFLSNSIWDVQIKGVPSHLEYEINERLKQLGIYPGSFLISQLPAETIESTIMETLPQLLYISVKKRGTIYTIEAIEKKKEKPDKTPPPRDLIATKSGIIEKMLIKEGQAVVNVDDLVNKGDLLVSGKLNESDEVDKANNGDDNQAIELVASEGAVYANTWYEVTVSSELTVEHQQLQGSYINHYLLNIGKVNIPIVFWPKIDYKERKVTEKEKPVYLFKRQMPFSFIERTTYDKQTVKLLRSEEEAKQKGIDHALLDLRNKLGKEAKINTYYILHEEVDSGKVKLRLYVSALENIALEMPIR